MIKRLSVFFIKFDRLLRVKFDNSYILFVENTKKIYYNVKISIKSKII